MNTSNANARQYVNQLIDFKGSHIFAETKEKQITNPLKNAVYQSNGITEKIYTVFSYGYHFPMYACIKNKWYGNSDKYSQSTSKHQNQTRPNGQINFVDTKTLQSLIA